MKSRKPAASGVDETKKGPATPVAGPRKSLSSRTHLKRIQKQYQRKVLLYASHIVPGSRGATVSKGQIQEPYRMSVAIHRRTLPTTTAPGLQPDTNHSGAVRRQPVDPQHDSRQRQTANLDNHRMPGNHTRDLASGDANFPGTRKRQWHGAGSFFRA